MARILIKNASLINEGKIFAADLLIENEYIKAILDPGSSESADQVIDAEGKYLIPGVIDDQVHFRDPGMEHKADLTTESKAAVAGGITSFMDMPNTIPNALTQEILEEKYELAKSKALANYSFYMGTSNDNADEVIKTDPKTVCGIKIFMGASTGNMLVDNKETLEKVFANAKTLIATHCEDEPTIRANFASYREKYGEDVPVECHPEIRSEEACFLSSAFATGLAKKHNSRLHVLHLTTAKELEHFTNKIPLEDKRITVEACVHHLWFCDKDYKEHGAFIKCNPAIKTQNDRDSLLAAVVDDTIDLIATDHAPHTTEEKSGTYFKSAAGLPLVQHSLAMMLEHYHNGKITLEKVIEKMCHAPAKTFKIEKRGFIREGYYADLTILDLDDPWTVAADNILYKCGWSPLKGQKFRSKVTHTIINGHIAYQNGSFDTSKKGMRLLFDR